MSLFKNITIFKIPNTSETIKDLKSNLSKFPVSEARANDEYAFGWSPLYKSSELWYIHVENFLLFQAGLSIRELPKKAINTALEAKVDQIEITEGRRVGRKEKADLKDEITLTLKSKAPLSFTTFQAYLDAKRGLLVINSTSNKTIDLFFKHIQTTLGSFPMTPLNPGLVPENIMTYWLVKNSLPPSLETGDKVYIQDSSEDNAHIQFGGLEPLSDDVIRHLEQGMKVNTIKLLHDSKTSFVINKDLQLSSIKFDQSLKEDAFNTSEGGKEADMHATLPLLGNAVGQIMDLLAKEFEIEFSN